LRDGQILAGGDAADRILDMKRYRDRFDWLPTGRRVMIDSRNRSRKDRRGSVGNSRKACETR
jgi:hypothetical protein